MTLDEKFDLIIKNQNSIMQMLCDMAEAAPGPGKQPDLMAALGPIMNSPIIKSNPIVEGMLKSFAEAMGNGGSS